ncbi:MAG: PINc/VapC family ATPase [Nanoarchaeota archaeon]|nr:PINc/VapC family ATPase [Nanoarchaeota archaeon]MBU4299764.1 PINc/VapC family ATPase [Nanoarchaeota archaeon]MBU4452578.1 PINc/VapC family ATPase [Nanoarchaeota archaeon]MCG2723543.1 PINc/VapC family ATPase [archaeon]
MKNTKKQKIETENIIVSKNAANAAEKHGALRQNADQQKQRADQQKTHVQKFVPDTSAIINGNVTDLVREGKLTGELVVPEFVIAELENQANHGKDIGFEGLEELKIIRELAEEKGITMSTIGRKPTIEEIQLAKSGRIDSLIRDIARNLKATLVTADMVQAKVAEAEGVKVLYFKKAEIERMSLEDYFTSDTMSVHLKEGCTPKAKRGKPGEFKLIEIDGELLTEDILENMAHEIFEKSRTSGGLLEMDLRGATVIQLGKYRIAITRHPFSEKMEITAVRPIVKVDIEKYKLSKKLLERFDERAEGIIVAGPPGHGKSTLAQAMAEFYQKKGKIVKTMEHPRDLQVGPEITQYGALNNDMANTADILLLVRPDFTIYDEVRSTKDFKIFADMRLAGVGMLGVIHATQAIDTIHRFIGRIELGLIPQVIDTIVYVRNGEIKQVYTLNLDVRTPTGMTEADLARPIIEILDFETGRLLFEAYTYGEQTVVIPIKSKAETSKINKLAEERLYEILKKRIANPRVEIISANRAILRVEEADMAYVIGREGSNIKELEKLTGMSLTVEPIIETLKKTIKYSVFEAGGYLSIVVPENYVGSKVDIYKGDEFLFSATIGKKAQVKIQKKSELGDKVLKAVALGNLNVLAG